MNLLPEPNIKNFFMVGGIVAAILLIANIASAGTPICSDYILEGDVCTMVTPYLVCEGDYFYELYNDQGTLLENNTMTSYIDGGYYWYFNESKGTYHISLCDETVRSVFVSQSSCRIENQFNTGLIWICVGLASISLLMILFNVFRSFDTLGRSRP